MGHSDDLKKVQIRKEQAATVRVIGERMRQASEIEYEMEQRGAQRIRALTP